MLSILVLTVAVIVGGVSGAPSHPYVINGEETAPNQYPWQASLELCIFGCSHTCGAVLITDQWLVTAAHCAEYATNLYAVKLGQHKVQDSSLTSRTVAEIILHENWENDNTKAFPNDIAVIRLAQPVTLSDTIQVIDLPARGEHSGNTNCYISGWGIYMQGSQTISSVLRHANVDVLSYEDCLVHWPGYVTTYHVCVHNPVNKQGACNGDSGGPLQCMVDGRWELVGVTSWGASGCDPQYPAAYTRVDSYKAWIRSKVQGGK